MTALGDFEAAGETLDGFVLYTIFGLATLLILIIMMNLLIGIISEKLAEVLEQKEKNDYFERCNLICDLENIMFWRRPGWGWPEKSEDWMYRHFIWANLQQQAEPWEGRVKATTTPINKALTAQNKEQISRDDNINNRLGGVEESIGDVSEGLKNTVEAGQAKMLSELMTFERTARSDFALIKE